MTIREDDMVSDYYDNDKVDYDSSEMHVPTTTGNHIATLNTNVHHFLGQTLNTNVRYVLGQMDMQYQRCGALHWMAEKLTSSSLIYPKFGTCCLQGKVRLPLLREPPIALRELYDGNNVRSIFSSETYSRI
ncbi:hypothetical protein MKX01_002278 [Papaver californicum]|nr:hypothetical protein MKX01_002278 [Papaver californicum]